MTFGTGVDYTVTASFARLRLRTAADYLSNHTLPRYVVAALSVLPPLGLWLLALPVSSQIPYMPFFLSVLFSAWFLGFGAGMVATVVSAVAVEYFILRSGPEFAGSQHILQLYFLITAILMSAMAAARKTAKEKFSLLTATLEDRVVERTADLEQEIDRQKAIDETLRQQAQLLQMTHDAIIVRAYSDGRIRFWNRAATDLYGWQEEEALGQVVRDLLRAKYPLPLKEIESQVSRFGFWEGELIHTRKTGGEIIVESRWSLERDADGDPIAILELNSDITEKKQAEQRAQNNERLAALGTAAAVFAHEIANPLNGISTSLQVMESELATKGELDPELRSTFDVATKEIQRLNTLLNELRSFARPRALNLKPIDLVETTEEVLVPEIANYRAAGITVKRQFEESLPPLMLDEDRIKQVILNLCKNAADAMPEGGTLTIKAYQQENGVALEVCDTGTGIPDGLDVFQLFATTKDNGTGVGLPVVRQIIGAHRGKVEYVSKPGEGTTFRVTLPLAKEIGSTTKNSMNYGYKFPADTP